MNRPRPYHVGYDDCTDLEPTPGWYIETDETSGDYAGPFDTQEKALAAFDEAQDARAERDWEFRTGAR